MSDQQTYQVGQVVNGHRWTGSTWEPVAGPAGAPVSPTPPPAPKKSIWTRWWFWLIAVIVLVIVIAAVSSGRGASSTPGATKGATESSGSTDTSAEGNKAAPSEEAPAAEEPDSGLPGIGEPVRDGKFEFVVQKPKCGVAKVGGSILGEKAQGQFCLIGVKVTNIGDEAQTLFDSNQVVFDAAGKKFEVDSAAGLYANKDSSVFLEGINPGNSVQGVLVFDLPKNTKPTVIELHDSAFSGGVQVSLT